MYHRSSAPGRLPARGASTIPIRLRRGHPHWPERWNHLTDPPALVTVTGRPEALTGRCLAMVGTRAATPRGLAVAEGLAAALAGWGWTIVSGLARGIDGAAHRGALLAGGRTIAIMGTGWDLTFPPAHARLRRDLERDGCAVTELTDGAPPMKHHFPRRNRLIAALAEGIVVVEAPEHSGALLTARLASDLGREVFAIPGPIDRPESRGCHALLRDGANLCEGPDDIHCQLSPPGVTGGSTSAPAFPEPSPGTGPPANPIAGSTADSKAGPTAEGPEGERGAGQAPGGVTGQATGLIPSPGSSARWIWDRLDLDGVPLIELRARWAWGEGAWAEGLMALDLAGLIRRLPGGILARRFWRP